MLARNGTQAQVWSESARGKEVDVANGHLKEVRPSSGEGVDSSISRCKARNVTEHVKAHRHLEDLKKRGSLLYFISRIQ